ncbi:MAG: gliding motility-associated C-terminal domain-containing protein, partial [Saprospiraceae bacterium]|nr:gliding motility-associated C-terminal domain-containing protein [Saprospiraceae bacterium]
SDNVQLMDSTCDPDSVGVFQYTDTNTNGCDSFTFVTVELIDQDTMYFTSGSCDPAEVGIFTETVTGAFCDEVHTTTVSLLASDNVQLTDSTCDPDSAGIFQFLDTNVYGCDSLTLLTIDLVDMDTLYFAEASCDPAAVGVFNSLSNNGFCDELSITTVSLSPTDTVYSTQTSCNQSQVGIIQLLEENIYGCDSLNIIETIYDGYDDFYFYETVCDTTLVGSVQYNFQTTDGCDSVVIVVSEFNPVFCSFQFQAEIDPVKCDPEFGRIGIEILSGSPPFSYVWENTDTGLQGSGTANATGTIFWIDQLVEGNYQIEIIDANGISQTEDYYLPHVQLPEVNGFVLNSFLGSPLSCPDASDAELVSEILVPGADPMELNWWSEEGVVTTPTVPQGTYFLELIDGNGCVARDTVVVTPPDEIQATFELASTSCPNASNGTLEILQTDGGLGTILFSLNNSNLSALTSYEDLSAGPYQLFFEDEFGCKNDTTFVIAQGTEPWLYLGEDHLIQFEDSVRLEPILSFDPGQLESIIWEPNLCSACLDPVVSPEQDQLYKLTLIDSAGCIANDEIWVRLRNDTEFFIPNAFSPNGDGNNDFFEIFFDKGIESIERTLIFDRWGELVFESNGPIFWDGKFAGQHMNPAVFVYQVWFNTNRGETIMIAGDVTLLR